MTSQMQNKRKRQRLPPWARWMIASIALLLIVIGATLWILKILGFIHGPFDTILYTGFVVLGVVFALFQWLFPVTDEYLNPYSPSLEYHNNENNPSSSPQLILQIPTLTTQPLIDQLSPIVKNTYRSILGVLPPTDYRTIQQREKVVQEVYTKLIQQGVTAIALTGIGGVGKSTLAALVYHFAEQQRKAGNGIFTAEALWFKIDNVVTMIDLVGNIFGALGKPLPDLGNLAPTNQAVALFHALNTIDRPRLIVLDQFENLLDWQTEHALADRPGVGEWLDAINSQQCTCRIILTSRLFPKGDYEYPPTYMQEFLVGRLEEREGVELLKQQGVELNQATDAELRTAVDRCEGHAQSLTLLASILRCNRSLNVSTLFNDLAYAQLWGGNIARNLLDYIYTKQLDQLQRSLLLAFSIYREAVTIDAVKDLVESNLKRSEVKSISALERLLSQHLLQAAGERRYQLHPIVASYAHNHFVEDDEQANKLARQVSHAKAAKYYLEIAAIKCPPLDKRRSIRDVQLLIEAIWHKCHAKQFREAYDLIELEKIYPDLHRWGGNAVLLEIYELLLPLEGWLNERSEVAHFYDNLASIYNVLGRKEQAMKYYEIVLEITREIKDRNKEGRALYKLGRVYNALGQKVRALEYYEQALSILRETGDRSGEGRTLSNLARVYNALGQKVRALEYYEQALSILRETGDRSGEGRALNNLSRVYRALRQREMAFKCCEQALTLLREVGDYAEEGRSLNNLGRIYNTFGQPEEALKYCEQALTILREVGDRGGEGRTLNNLGRIYYALGQNEESMKFYEQALSTLKEVGDLGEELQLFSNLGELSKSNREKEQGLRYYEQALVMSKEVGDRWAEGVMVQNIGILFEEVHKYKAALACFVLSRSIFNEVHSPNRDKTQERIERLKEEVGMERFSALSEQVVPQVQQVIEQALHEGLGMDKNLTKYEGQT